MPLVPECVPAAAAIWSDLWQWNTLAWCDRLKPCDDCAHSKKRFSCKIYKGVTAKLNIDFIIFQMKWYIVDFHVHSNGEIISEFLVKKISKFCIPNKNKPTGVKVHFLYQDECFKWINCCASYNRRGYFTVHARW